MPQLPRGATTPPTIKEMLHVRLTLFIFVFGFAGCVTPSDLCEDIGLAEGREQALARGMKFVSEQELSVYAAIIDDLSASQTNGLTIILDTTQPFSFFDVYSKTDRATRLQNNLESLRADTLRDFRRKSGEERLIGDEICRFRDCSLISDSWMTELLNQKHGWDRFHERFPGGRMIGFSRVGFNQAQTQALVFVIGTSGGLSGISYVALLEKNVRGEWEKTDEHVFTIS